MHWGWGGIRGLNGNGKNTVKIKKIKSINRPLEKRKKKYKNDLWPGPKAAMCPKELFARLIRKQT